MDLIMARSSDGFVSRGDVDDMRWTGPMDKAIFQLVSSTASALVASAKTAEQMPSLRGRPKLYAVSTQPGALSLEQVAATYPDALMLGGQTLAMSALKSGFVTSVYLCTVPVTLGGGQEDRLTPYLEKRAFSPGRGTWWTNELTMDFGAARVDLWRRGSAIDGEALAE